MRYPILALTLLLCLACGGPELNADGTPMTERQMLVDDQFSGWDGSHVALTNQIKSGLNDPDSYEHIETVFKDEGETVLVRTRFRAKNGFGGKVAKTVNARVDTEGNVIEILN